MALPPKATPSKTCHSSLCILLDGLGRDDIAASLVQACVDPSSCDHTSVDHCTEVLLEAASPQQPPLCLLTRMEPHCGGLGDGTTDQDVVERVRRIGCDYLVMVCYLAAQHTTTTGTAEDCETALLERLCKRLRYWRALRDRRGVPLFREQLTPDGKRRLQVIVLKVMVNAASELFGADQPCDLDRFDDLLRAAADDDKVLFRGVRVDGNPHACCEENDTRVLAADAASSLRWLSTLASPPDYHVCRPTDREPGSGQDLSEFASGSLPGSKCVCQ